MATLYDQIGTTYTHKRMPDPRIAAAIENALEGCTSVLNVGAGAGSYEPRSGNVLAVEPSRVMIAQRPKGSAPVVQARAEALPFPDQTFDAVLCVLTVHHWADQSRGLAECRRVSRDRVVFFTIDLDQASGFWLYDYFPTLLAIDAQIFPRIDRFSEAYGPVEVTPVLVPDDCRDGFLGAYWRRPGAYLDALVRGSISTFSKLARVDLDIGLDALRSDIDSGAWSERYSGIETREAIDLGYRLISASDQRAPGG
jgi:SAM-dependent methyltransferase